MITLVAPGDAVLQESLEPAFHYCSPLMLAAFLGRGPQEGYLVLGITPVLKLVSSQGVGS